MTTFFERLDLFNGLLLVSGTASAAVVFYLALRSRRPRTIVATLVLLLVGALIVYAVSPTATITRGDEANGVTLVISYVAMLLGMAAHYFYAQADRGAKKVKFQWLAFLMPILASPIVFIPLVSIAGEVPAVGGAFTHAKVMVYLVAFQNGFFWKHFFERQKQEAAPARQKAA